MKIQKYKLRLAKAGVLRVSEPRVDCFERACDVFYELMAGLPHEEVHLLLLNGRSDIIGTVKVSQGGLHGCALTARDVLCPVVAGGASAFIMAHNHPSGDPQPSPDDVEMTKHVQKCAELLGVPMLDHLVICPEKRLSRSVVDG